MKAKIIDAILIGIIVVGFLVTCGFSINKAYAHENECWEHSGTGLYNTSQSCELGIRRYSLITDGVETNVNYFLWDGSFLHRLRVDNDLCSDWFTIRCGENVYETRNQE